MSVNTVHLQQCAWKNPEDLKKIIRDEHSTWDAVLHEVDRIKNGYSALPHMPIDEYRSEFNRSFVLAAARRLRGSGYRDVVEAAIQLRIARACLYSTQLCYKAEPLLHRALERDCEVACWLLSLPSKHRSRTYSNQIGRCLDKLARRIDVESAREEIRQLQFSTFEMAPPRRSRRPRHAAVLPRLIGFSHAVLVHRGLEIHGEECSPIFVELKQRFVRLMLASWLIGLGAPVEGNVISNTPRRLYFSIASLKRMVGSTASRTNLSQLRKSIVFDGIEFLSGMPPTSVVPVTLGFAQTGGIEVIACRELERLAESYQIKWKADSRD